MAQNNVKKNSGTLLHHDSTNNPLNVCPYLRQILTDFHNYFDDTFSAIFAITRLLRRKYPIHILTACVVTQP